MRKENVVEGKEIGMDGRKMECGGSRELIEEIRRVKKRRGWGKRVTGMV